MWINSKKYPLVKAPKQDFSNSFCLGRRVCVAKFIEGVLT